MLEYIKEIGQQIVSGVWSFFLIIKLIYREDDICLVIFCNGERFSAILIEFWKIYYKILIG